MPELVRGQLPEPGEGRELCVGPPDLIKESS